MKRYANTHVSDHPVLWRHLLKIARFARSREKWRNADPGLIEASFQPDAKVQRLIKPHTLMPGQTRVTVLGHATALVSTTHMNILIDPVWATVVGPMELFGPRRKKPIMALNSLPQVHIVLISHDHYDHLDIKALQFLCRRDQPLILAGQGVGAVIRKKIPAARVIELGWWQSYDHDGYRLTFVPAQHFSGRSLWMNNTLWGGFVVEGPGESFYYVGDSGYQDAIISAMVQRFPRLDWALIPIGSYEPYEYLKTYHLSPPEAVRLFQKLGVKKGFALHFGTFQLSIENEERQVQEFLKAREGLGARVHDFILPVFGADYLLEGKS